MLERVIDSLKSPLDTLLTDSTIKAYMGSGVSTIPVYVNSMPSSTTPPPCWVLLRPQEGDTFQVQFLGRGVSDITADMMQFTVEAYSMGNTSKVAEDRAAQLLLEVNRQIRLTLQGTFTSLTRASLVAPTTTSEKPNWWQLIVPPKQPVTEGPNAASQYTAQRYSLVKVSKFITLGS